jgi:hypothetical protein
MKEILLDPTAELGPADREPLAQPDSLEGLTIGLLDISKTKGDIFLNRIDAHFKDRGLNTVRFKKPTFTRPASDALLAEIASQCDVVVEALAD